MNQILHGYYLDYSIANLNWMTNFLKSHTDMTWHEILSMNVKDMVDRYYHEEIKANNVREQGE